MSEALPCPLTSEPKAGAQCAKRACWDLCRAAAREGGPYCERTRLGGPVLEGIERACRGNVAFKVIAAMAAPDHSTVAEFRRRHEAAIGELFVSVLAPCGEAGLVRVGRSRSTGPGCARVPRGIAIMGMSRW